jgi:glycosyltransferase 2 family protein
MQRIMDRLWPVIGLAAVVFTGWLLYEELRGHSLAEFMAAFRAISPLRWLLAFLSSALAYVALACYDQLALAHLGRRLDWRFVGLTSFTAYALGHNIGATVVSGGLVRYRAYSTKGLSPAEVGLLVAFTSLTFALGSLLLGGLTLLLDPGLLHRWVDWPRPAAIGIAGALLVWPWLYVLGALFHFPPLKIGGFPLVYPRPPIAGLQMVIAPVELIGAAGIIYFALPPETNPGFLAVLGVFVASFALSLISHAPGGLGVLEFAFLKAAPDVPAAELVAALLSFRLLYLILPLLASLVIAAIFEKRRSRVADSGLERSAVK